MIPYGLEKLILEGLAVAKTRCIGYTGVATLEVPDGKQVVIYRLHYYFGHLFGRDIIGNADSDMSLTIQSEKKTDNISFKPLNNAAINPFQATETKIELYSLHFSDIRFRHTLTGQAFPAIDFGVLPARAKEPVPPEGYGTTIPALIGLTLSTGQLYLPQGTGYSALPIGGLSRNDYHNSVVLGTSELPQASLPAEGYLLNVSYVEINLGYNNKIQ